MKQQETFNHLQFAVAGIDDEYDSIHCERGLRDVGGHHALPDPVLRPLEDLRLQIGGQLRVDRQDGELGRVVDLGQPLGQDLAGDLDVLLAGHEDQDVARGRLQVDLQRLLDGRVHVVLDRVLAEEGLDGEGAPGDGERGHVAEEHGELARVHGGRGDD